MDLVPKKTILLKLAECMTGSDSSDRHRMGYLVRRWKDERVPVSQKLQVKEELNKLRRELTARKKQVDERLKCMVQAQREREENLAGPKKDIAQEQTENGNPGGEKKKEAAAVALKDLPLMTRSCWPYFKEVFMISALDGDGVQKFTVGYGGVAC